jgi:WD40 repeat protein
MNLLALSALVIGAQSVSVTQTRTLQNVHVLNLCAATTGAKFAASVEDNSVQVIDAKSGTTLRKLVGHPQPVYGLAFNKAGTILATGDESARIYLWNVSTGQKMREFTRLNAHTRGIQSLNFSADGKQLVSAGRDDVIIIWDVATGKPLKKILGDGLNVASAAFRTNSPALYAATLGEGVKMWNRSNGSTSALGGHEGRGANDFVLSATGAKAVSGGMNNSVCVWDLGGKKRIAEMKGHEDAVIHVALSPTGRLAASGSSDRTVRVWDLTSYKAIGTIAECSSVGSPVCFTGDGNYLISANMSDQVVISKVSIGSSGKGKK